MSWIAFLAVLGLNGSPSYSRYRLHELVSNSDRVVVGTIVGLQELTFDLAVESTLVGGSWQAFNLVIMSC